MHLVVTHLVATLTAATQLAAKALTVRHQAVADQTVKLMEQQAELQQQPRTAAKLILVDKV